MKFKVLTAAVALLFFTVPAYASGPGSTYLRLLSVQKVRSSNGQFSISGFTDAAKKKRVEIVGSRADNDEMIDTAISFASRMLNYSVQEPLSLSIKLNFTGVASGITREGVSTVSYSVNNSSTINDIWIVKHKRFDNSIFSSENVQETFVLLLRNRAGIYVVRTADAKGNTVQWVGNLNNDQVAKDCLTSGVGVLTNEGYERKAVDITGNAISHTSSVTTGGQSSGSVYLTKMQRCSIEQSEHRVAIAN